MDIVGKLIVMVSRETLCSDCRFEVAKMDLSETLLAKLLKGRG